MELPKVETGVDLLSQLSEDDWREIAAANLQLGSEEEAVALGDVERVMHTDKIEGERVRIIGYALAEDGSYSLQAVEGVADMVASLEIDPDNPAPFATYTNEMAALCVRAARDNVASDYYFPLDRQAIVSAELLPDTSGISRHIRKLRHYVNKTQEAVDVYGIHDNESKIQLLDDLNGVLDEMVHGAKVRIECQAYRRRVGNIEYGVDVRAEKQVLSGDAPFFVWRGGRPELEMCDAQDPSVLFYIDMNDVCDIFPVNDDSGEDGNDLFETVFTEEFQQLAWRLATDLSYTDESDFSNTLREHTQTLNDALPDSSELDAVSLAGFVLAPRGSRKRLQYEFIDNDEAYVEGVKFARYDGAIYAVIEVVMFDRLNGLSRKVYAIPSRDRLLRFESLRNDAEDLELAIASLYDIAQDASELFDRETFYDFPLKEQIEILKQYDNEAHNVLVTINDPREFSGECTVMAYRCLPGSLLNVISWNDVPLQEVGDDKDTEPFTLQVDSLEVWNPELNSMTELSQPISSISELPLSFGEPVLMVGNCEDDEFYLVCARDIIGLSRINPRNIS
jgi:hypothetical protein